MHQLHFVHDGNVLWVGYFTFVHLIPSKFWTTSYTRTGLMWDALMPSFQQIFSHQLRLISLGIRCRVIFSVSQGLQSSVVESSLSTVRINHRVLIDRFSQVFNFNLFSCTCQIVLGHLDTHYHYQWVVSCLLTIYINDDNQMISHMVDFNSFIRTFYIVLGHLDTHYHYQWVVSHLLTVYIKYW